MSITYEQALGTLTSMFAAPWTEDSLDVVLRHFEGHMENTVDAVLTHGDSDPQLLIKMLESGTSQEDLDEQLARELADGTPQQQINAFNNTSSRVAANRNTSATSGTSSSISNSSNQLSEKKGRGTPTTLPDDFLRIPGKNGSISGDEALARMLQDKLFAEELRNNPEFAHLAQGRVAGGHRYPGVNRNHHQQQHEGPNILEALGSMGENAKKRLQELVIKVKQNVNNIDNGNARRNTGPFSNNAVASERRGLLDLGEDDDDEQEISFVGSGQQSTNYEMRDFDK